MLICKYYTLFRSFDIINIRSIMNVIMALIMREINLVWSKIMRKEISEDEKGQNKWFVIVLTLTIVFVLIQLLLFLVM